MDLNRKNLYFRFLKHIYMSKFGELLDEKKPLLLVFFSEFDELSISLHPILKDVAAALGDKGKVIKINTEKNIKFLCSMQQRNWRQKAKN